MALQVEFLEPIHILLFEHLPDRKEMNHAAPRLDAARRFDGVTLGLVVEMAFLVVPMRILPTRKIAGHLEVERDRYQRLVARRRRSLRQRANASQGCTD